MFFAREAHAGIPAARGRRPRQPTLSETAMRGEPLANQSSPAATHQDVSARRAKQGTPCPMSKPHPAKAQATHAQRNRHAGGAAGQPKRPGRHTPNCQPAERNRADPALTSQRHPAKPKQPGCHSQNGSARRARQDSPALPSKRYPASCIPIVANVQTILTAMMTFRP